MSRVSTATRAFVIGCPAELSSCPATSALERKPIVRRVRLLPRVKRAVIVAGSVALAPLRAPRSDGVATSAS
jgi:hypothetical protein